MRYRLLLSMALGLGVAGAAFAAPHISPAIAKALADPSRPADDRALDAVRKPAEVMAYAGIHPGEHVAEYLPGGGYYTRLLSDAVGPTGKIFALETTTWKGSVEAEQKVLAEPGRGNVVLDSATLGDFHLAEKVDLFWTTLNYHDLHIAKYANVDMAVFNKHVYDSLKPGGLYVIEDHAAATGTGATLSPTLHRIEKAQVIKEVTAAGFKLVGESDVLANASDDHAKPVFDLKFKTDQFILKFRKP